MIDYKKDVVALNNIVKLYSGTGHKISIELIEY